MSSLVWSFLDFLTIVALATSTVVPTNTSASGVNRRLRLDTLALRWRSGKKYRHVAETTKALEQRVDWFCVRVLDVDLKVPRSHRLLFLQHLVDSCVNVTACRLRDVHRVDFRSASKLRSLTTLEISAAPRGLPKGLELLCTPYLDSWPLDQCPNLVELRPFCGAFPANLAPTLCDLNFKNLQRVPLLLNITNTGVDFSVEAALTKLPHCQLQVALQDRSFELSRVFAFSDFLTNLSVSFLHLKDASWHQRFFELTSACPNLMILRLEYVTFLAADATSGPWPALTRLLLTGQASASLLPLFEQASKLTHVDLTLVYTGPKVCLPSVRDLALRNCRHECLADLMCAFPCLTALAVMCRRDLVLDAHAPDDAQVCRGHILQEAAALQGVFSFFLALPRTVTTLTLDVDELNLALVGQMHTLRANGLVLQSATIDVQQRLHLSRSGDRRSRQKLKARLLKLAPSLMLCRCFCPYVPYVDRLPRNLHRCAGHSCVLCEREEYPRKRVQ